MKGFLDASILIEACLEQSPHFAAADALLHDPENFTSAHALLEAYATLSGDPRLRLNPADAARMVEDIAKLTGLRVLPAADHCPLITAAPARGIRGGMIYDALHAQIARQSGAKVIYTLNLGHFQHVAPDLAVAGL